jgi:hypothetical protein
MCLNRDRAQKNKLLNTCNNEPFIPIDALEKLLKYANEKETATDEINRDNNSQNCYNFDLAWKIVITDIADKMDVMKENDFVEALNKPEIIEKLKKKIKETPQPELKTPLNLQELFRKIIKVGRLRWDNPISCNDNTNVDCVAAAILDNLAALVESSSFKLLSDDIENITENPDELTLDLEEEESSPSEGGAPPIDNATILDEIKNLFKYTISIMNLKGDLTNTIPKEERTVEFIEAKFQKLNEIIKKAYPVVGGKKKTRKNNKRNNKKTQKKGGLKLFDIAKTVFMKTKMVLRMAIFIPLYIPAGISIIVLGLFFDVDSENILAAIDFFETNARTDKGKKFHQALQYYEKNHYKSNIDAVLNSIQQKYGNDARNYVVEKNNYLDNGFRVDSERDSERFKEARKYYEKNNHKHSNKEDFLNSIEKKYGVDAREYIIGIKAEEEEKRYENYKKKEETAKKNAYKNLKKTSPEEGEIDFGEFSFPVTSEPEKDEEPEEDEEEDKRQRRFEEEKSKGPGHIYDLARASLEEDSNGGRKTKRSKTKRSKTKRSKTKQHNTRKNKYT